MADEKRIQDLPVEHIKNIFGEHDAFAILIEKAFHVELLVRDSGIAVRGDAQDTEMAAHVLEELAALSMRGNTITRQNVEYAVELAKDHDDASISALSDDIICHTVNGKPVQPKTHGQKKYVDALRQSMITFGIGPAGTGKTYLAIAMAVRAFRNQEVDRIILTRPAIEAGEKLGFLPGDLQSKIDPYLRPLYDALYQIMGSESFQHNLEKGAIEVAPLAYMRGRTLDNAYIILDEAQNTTPSQMKMFLTRIGFNSRCIVTGDRTQKDLPRDQQSGLDLAMKILKKIDEIAFVELTGRDVVRHPLVQKIVAAYESYEAVHAPKEENRKPFGGRHDRSYRE
ncbi:MAG: PhoH family protein [Lachnospiraceae bacterium]|nr:PhoH family protein [Lachnospiraceae bacterium]